MPRQIKKFFFFSFLQKIINEKEKGTKNIFQEVWGENFKI